MSNEAVSTEMSNEIGKRIGKEIRHVRMATGLSQAELGERAGVGGAQISKLESDCLRVSMKLFIKVCEVLEYNPIIFGTSQQAPRDPSRQVFIIFGSFHLKPFYGYLLRDLQKHLRMRGFEPIAKIPESNFDIGSQGLNMNEVLDNKENYLAGIIVPVEPEDTEGKFRNFLSLFKKPVIFLDETPFKSEDSYPPNTAFISYNNESGGKLAAQGMISALQKSNVISPRVLVIASIRQTQRQVTFIEQLMMEFPDATKPEDVEEGSGFRRNRARTIARRRLRRAQEDGRPYNAVFCTNDESLYGVIDALRELSDIITTPPIVFGYDGLEETLAAIERDDSPIENSVIQDTDSLAAFCASILNDKLNDIQVQCMHLLEPRLYL